MMEAILLSTQRLHLAPSLPLSSRRSQLLSTTVIMRKHKARLPMEKQPPPMGMDTFCHILCSLPCPSHVLHSEPPGLGKLYGVSFISFSIPGVTLIECKFSLAGGGGLGGRNSCLTASMEYISLLIGEARTV